MALGNCLRTALAVAAAAVVLGGCAAGMAFREGNTLMAGGRTVEGLAKIDEAAALEPRNTEYRMAALARRAAAANQFIAAGDAARADGRHADAEKAYLEALRLQPNHQFARQALDATVADKRHREQVAKAEILAKDGSNASQTDALELLRNVLVENPTQKEALKLRARIEEARAVALRPQAKLAAIYQKPITLEFRDAPLRSVFDVIARVSGLNFFFDRDVRPDARATVLAKNTPIHEAIRLLLVTNQLEQQILNENSVLIYPATPQKLREYQTLVMRTFYLTNADVKAVSNTIRTMVKTRDMVIDERLGLIMMRDTPEAIRLAERIVALQDLADPEVMLEVEVLEVKRTRLLELGILWPAKLQLSVLPSGTTPLTLDNLRSRLHSSNIGVSGIGAVVNANKLDGDGKTLANPRIRVRNREKAKVLIGDRVPVITTTLTASGFSSESVSYLDVGLKLEVEPNIHLDDEVAIKINLEVSNVVNEVTSKSGTQAYQIGTRGASTVLRLKDGETQILAGLISDDDRSSGSRIPALGDLPILGRLFGSQKDESQRTEILLSITPRVLRSIRRPDLLQAEFEAGTESSIGGQSLRLSEGQPGQQPGGSPGGAPGGPPRGGPGGVPGMPGPGSMPGGVPGGAQPMPQMPPNMPGMPGSPGSPSMPGAPPGTPGPFGVPPGGAPAPPMPPPGMGSPPPTMPGAAPTPPRPPGG